jgi:hypothetical protein
VEVEIDARDPWFKVVEMLQQNWAFISPHSASECIVYFVSDDSGVFDEIRCASIASAEEALLRNGFRRLCEDPRASEFLSAPGGPFDRREHPNGRIYSSGRFWT